MTLKHSFLAAFALIAVPALAIPAFASRAPGNDVVVAAPPTHKVEVTQVNEKKVIVTTDDVSATAFVLISAHLNADGTIDSVYGLATDATKN